MVSLDDRTQGIDNFKITTRINEGVTNFEINYLTPLKPDGLVCGEYVYIELFDTASPGQTTVVGGRIQKISRNNKDNNKIYSISGRDNGFFLIKNKFNLNCSLTSETTFTTSEMLESIVADEPIEIGGGNPTLDDSILLHTNGNLSAGYCGIFKNKKIAIDKLFKLYALQTGCNRIRWYIDNEGKLRWFETNTTRNIIEFEIETQSELIEDFTIEENAENIVNQLTGYACDDEIKSTQSDSASIARYGLQVGDDISNSDITSQSELNSYVKKELDAQAWPIYTATLVLKKYYNIEVGQQMRFTDDANYSNVIFTCTQITVEGSPADVKTTLNFSTDENAIAPATVADVTSAIINNALSDTSSRLGTVVDVSGEDCTNLLVRPSGSDTLVNVKSTNGCTSYNVSGLSGG